MFLTEVGETHHLLGVEGSYLLLEKGAFGSDQGPGKVSLES